MAETKEDPLAWQRAMPPIEVLLSRNRQFVHDLEKAGRTPEEIDKELSVRHEKVETFFVMNADLMETKDHEILSQSASYSRSLYLKSAIPAFLINFVLGPMSNDRFYRKPLLLKIAVRAGLFAVALGYTKVVYVDDVERHVDLYITDKYSSRIDKYAVTRDSSIVNRDLKGVKPKPINI